MPHEVLELEKLDIAQLLKLLKTVQIYLNANFEAQGAIKDALREKVEQIVQENISIEELNQIECAKKMKTSQSTFQRILTSAYKKISQALIDGKVIRVVKEE